MNEDPAAKRFFAIQAVRILGVVLTIVALLVVREVAPWPAGLPRELGYGLLVIGLVIAFLGPHFLSRRWASRRQ